MFQKLMIDVFKSILFVCLTCCNQSYGFILLCFFSTGAFYRCSFTKLIIVVITQPFTPSSPRLRRTYSERTPPTSAPGSPFATPRHIPGIPRGNFHLERYVRSFSSGTTSSVSRDSPSPAGDSTPSRDSPRSSVSSGNASPIGKSPWKSRSSYT